MYQPIAFNSKIREYLKKYNAKLPKETLHPDVNNEYLYNIDKP